jgi:hypothetical protein
MIRWKVASTPWRGRTCSEASAGNSTLPLYFRRVSNEIVANELQQMSTREARPEKVDVRNVQISPPLRIRECLYKTSTLVEVKVFPSDIFQKGRIWRLPLPI